MLIRRRVALLFAALLTACALHGCATTADLDALRSDLRQGVLSLQRSIDDLESDVRAVQSSQQRLAQATEQRLSDAESKVTTMDDRVAELRLAFSELIRSLRDARRYGFRWDDPTEQAN